MISATASPAPVLSCAPALVLPGDHAAIRTVTDDDRSLLVAPGGTVAEVVAGQLTPLGYAVSRPEGPLHASLRGDVVAVVESDGLRCRNATTGVALWRRTGMIEEVAFTLDASLLWAVERVAPEHIRLLCLATADGAVVAEQDMMDPFFGSTTRLVAPRVTSTPDSEQMVLELGGGQDGIGSWLLTRVNGDVASTELFPRQERVVTAWSPSGRRALAWDNTEQRYLACDWAGVSPEVTAVGDDDTFDAHEGVGYWETFLTEDLALVQSGDDRLWAFVVDSLRLGPELELDGFPPFPSRRIFGGSSEALMAPFKTVRRCGGQLVLTTWAPLGTEPTTVVVAVATVRKAIAEQGA
ncbi:hypothetical protein [Arachnia propionica]|uniref:Uncharacterized protein n=1 Tax=Arachnia propionica TaxID=1750 RepID=A0A3P1WRU5_9ACTN|nr:hypothetical protein [Arachnia propionica]RRD49349.1 hypothetical protein EII35_08790 [Arachnia propionica]